jgi:acetyl esterase/lipase
MLVSRALGGALLLASLPLAASAPPASLTTHIYKTVGELPLRADVFRPDDRGGRPIVLWVHGGGLVHGHRRGLPEDQRRLYLQSGHVVVCIDYRLAPETKLPGILEDLGDAWAWVRGHATEIGGDPERIAVVGQSAGGHLALAAGQRLHPAPRAIVSFDTAVPVAQAHQMAETMGKAGVPHRARTLPGRDHAFDLAEGALRERDVAETFGDTLVFLSRWLGSPPPLAASSAPSGRLERLHALVEAHVQAVHAYQILLARKSAKGNPACWSADLDDAELKSLEAHQASLLREDVAAVRAWVEGLPSSFDPARNLDPLRKAALPLASNLPVSLITADLAARAASPDPVGIRALANLYQTIFEVDRDGDRLQELFSFYIALGLPVSVAPLGLPGGDADFLAWGETLSPRACASPFGTSASEFQIAGRKIWNWREKHLHLHRTDEDFAAFDRIGKAFRQAGAQVYWFDNVEDPQTHKAGQVERNAAAARAAGMTVVEVERLLANAPGRDTFLCLDGIHMTEPWHRLMAKQWLALLVGARGARLGQ